MGTARGAIGQGVVRVADEALPLRPMTGSELLDAAIDVVRRHPVRLIGTGILLAAVEQLLLHPLRLPASADLFPFDPRFDFGSVWLLLAAGFGTEAVAIGFLGALAARPAVELLLGDRAPAPGRRRLVPAAALSLLVGGGAFATFWLGGIGWVFWFMLTGLVTPSLIVDTVYVPGVGRRPVAAYEAFFRSFGLVGRAGLRPGGIRLIGYTGWLGIRVLIGFGARYAFENVLGFGSSTALTVVGYVLWIVVNAVTYAAIAGLDAVNLLETRMRTEGLDIYVGRAIRNRTPIETAMVVPR